MSEPETPFPKHWLYYIILKWTVIGVAILVALYIAYRLFWPGTV
jgi:hypothetical protein